MATAFAMMRPFIHQLPPETAHNLGLFALKHKLLPAVRVCHFPELEVKTLGLTFGNPLGLAAGFDKNAVAVNALLDQGFGFVEAGTVTPQPQPGNPKPRIFRLREDQAVINRLGFNNNGLKTFVDNFRQRNPDKGIAGANIGRNKDAKDTISDYVEGLNAVYAYADYITVNVSSPNTQGLRALQEREALTELLSALQAARKTCIVNHRKTVPLLLKIAPDLEEEDLRNIALVVLDLDISGVIISNTTISRPPSLRSLHADETGGLSGRPLLDLSNRRLKYFYRLTDGTIPLIGVGGISSAHDAYMKIRAGATLVQLYTALVYQGFSVVREVQKGLKALLAQDGFSNIQQAIGIDANS